jgi:hypothetical protein
MHPSRLEGENFPNTLIGGAGGLHEQARPDPPPYYNQTLSSSWGRSMQIAGGYRKVLGTLHSWTRVLASPWFCVAEKFRITHSELRQSLYCGMEGWGPVKTQAQVAGLASPHHVLYFDHFCLCVTWPVVSKAFPANLGELAVHACLLKYFVSVPSVG